MPWYSFRRFPVVRPRPDGRFDLVLDVHHRATLDALLGELDGLIGGDPGDPDLRRLAPPAYVDDPDRELEFQLLAGDELRTSRRATIASVHTSMERSTLGEDQLWGWLQALNSLRQVVGTKLGIEDDDYDEPEDLDGHPDAGLWAIYDFVAQIEGEITLVLAG